MRKRTSVSDGVTEHNDWMRGVRRGQERKQMEAGAEVSDRIDSIKRELVVGGARD